MAHEPDWQAVANRLRKLPGVRIVTFEISEPISEDDRQVAEIVGAAALPRPVIDTLTAGNGVKLVWSGELAGKAVEGSLNILPFLEAATRAGATEESDPLEGVLWDAEFPDATKKTLREMVVFEALAGRSAHLAYRLDDPHARLHLVEGAEIIPLIPSFAEVVGLLARYAGINGLRELLTGKDWEERLAANAQMQALAAA